MDKKNLPKTNVLASYTAYKEAKLIKADRWHIEFWQGASEKMIRYRPTFDINRIESKKERKNSADEIIEYLNEMLGKGIPANVIIADIKKHGRGRIKFASDPYPLFRTPLKVAFQSIIDLKCQTDNKNSKKSYRYMLNSFSKYMITKNIETLSVSEMSKREAIAFMDTIVMKGHSNTTYNNNLLCMNIIWGELIRREYTDKNPFKDIKYKKKSPKLRRNLTEKERKDIAQYCNDNDKWLFRAIVLQYYMLIRPSELARLRFKDFDCQSGTIRLSADITKNGKAAVLTIPSIALKYLLDGDDFITYPTNYLVFGDKFVPNAIKPVAENWFNNRHRAVLDKLKAEGILGDTTGISFYSWKDTGITDFANDPSVSIFKTSLHARHSDPKITLIYYHDSMITPEIRQYQKRIL
jgi:integrase